VWDGEKWVCRGKRGGGVNGHRRADAQEGGAPMGGAERDRDGQEVCDCGGGHVLQVRV
jgi:hypothetical protein